MEGKFGGRREPSRQPRSVIDNLRGKKQYHILEEKGRESARLEFSCQGHVVRQNSEKIEENLNTPI